MHQALSILAATTTTVAGSKKSTSSSYTFLFIIVLFAAAYFLFIRPRQQRLRQQQNVAKQLGVGDEVVTAGGINGTLVSLSDDLAEVEVAPGVVITFLRRAVNAKPGSASASGTTGSMTYGGSSSPSAGSATPDEHREQTGEAEHDTGHNEGHDETDRPGGAGDADT